MDGDRIKVIGTFVAIFLVLCGYYYFTQGRQNIQQQAEQQAIQKVNQTKQISKVTETPSGVYYKVHVAGEVMKPGVYTLSSDKRVIDAIEAAGGSTENADLDRINLAENIKDAEKIRVPNISERSNSNNNNSLSSLDSFDPNQNQIESINSNATNSGNYNLSSSGTSDKISSAELININTASVSKLEELPGVGSTIANSIIDYREKNGDFKSIEDLKNVSRIGSKTYDKLKDLITVN